MVQGVQNQSCTGVSSAVRVGTPYFAATIRHMFRRSHVRAASPPGGSAQACSPPPTARYRTEWKKNPQIQKSAVLAGATLSKEVARELERPNRLLMSARPAPEFDHRLSILQLHQVFVPSKDLHNNNSPIFHLIFRPSLAGPQSRNPQRRIATLPIPLNRTQPNLT